MKVYNFVVENNIIKSQYLIENMKEREQYINKLYELRKKIEHSTVTEKDAYICDYKKYECRKCKGCKINEMFVTEDKAIKKLKTFNNGINEEIIKNIEKTDIDIMISGSSGIASVIKKGFNPKDIDIYIKNINIDKIIEVENAIKRTAEQYGYDVIVVRRPITLSWWMYNYNEEVVCEIQLNILDVTSWTDVFMAYHSDLVGIGYDVRHKKLVVMSERWNNFIKAYPEVYFTNINSLDEDLIVSAAKKYSNRGFVSILFSIANTKKKAITSLSGCGDARKIIEKLSPPETNYAVAGTAKYMVGGKPTSILKIKEISCEHVDYEFPDGKECPITMETYDIGVANVNCKHEVSLKGYIVTKGLSECPICRGKFIPVIYNSITGERPMNKIKEWNHMNL